MSVQLQYLRDDVDAEKSPLYRDICYGFLLENNSITMMDKVTGRGKSLRFNSTSPIKAVRVFSPALKNNKSVPFTEQEMGLMKALKEASPEVFEPVTFGEDYLEVSTDCSADQFWFCLNGMRILYDPYFTTYRFYETLIPIIGIWKTFLIVGGYCFSQAYNAKIPSVSQGFYTGWTCVWAPMSTNLEFLATLYANPMALLHQMEPINDASPLYEDSDDTGIMTETLQSRFNRKSFTFEEVLDVLEITSEQKAGMAKYLKW